MTFYLITISRHTGTLQEDTTTRQRFVVGVKDPSMAYLDVCSVVPQEIMHNVHGLSPPTIETVESLSFDDDVSALGPLLISHNRFDVWKAPETISPS